LRYFSPVDRHRRPTILADRPVEARVIVV
jgi:hypothetical protein